MLKLATFIKKKIEFSCIDQEFKEALAKLINGLIEDENIDKKCFKHPFGFIQVKVIDFDSIPLESLRIHIWSNTRITQKPYYSVHNHSFDFKSLVLCGHIVNSKYSVQNVSDSENCIYTVRYDDKNSTSKLLKTEEVVSCNVATKSVVSAGQFYVLKKDEFHSTDVNADIYAATLFSTFNRSGKICVIGKKEGDQEYIFERQHFDKDILVGELKKLQNTIEVERF